MLSTKVIFTEQDFSKQKYEPTLTIDGVPYVGDQTLGALEEITISRAFKYQKDPQHKTKATQMLLDGIKRQFPDCKDPARIGNTMEPQSLEESLEFMQNILVKKMGKGMQISPVDFSEWFSQLAEEQKQTHLGKTIPAISLSSEGKYSQLFELCSRKRT